MARVIDPSWIEIQTGLYLEEYNLVIGGTSYIRRKLHSSDGYCFWNNQDVNNYDEEGNLRPENERIYMQDASLGINQSSWTYDQLNAVFISVPVQEGYEIVSVTPPAVEI